MKQKGLGFVVITLIFLLTLCSNVFAMPVEQSAGSREISAISTAATTVSEKALNGWQASNGQWYYYQNGVKLTRQWLKYQNRWYYLDSYSRMALGFYKIDNAIFFFQKSGVMKTGWLFRDGSYYYFDAYGRMVIGWKTINNKTYYFDGSGRMVHDRYIDNYYLQADGSLRFGFTSSAAGNNSGIYFINAQGHYHTGWLEYYGNYYYFATNGKMITDAWVKNDYYVKASGVMAKNEWIFYRGHYYYCGSNGIYYRNRWFGNYYLKPTGILATGWFEVNGLYYYSNAGGVCQMNTWIDGKYYVNQGGVMAQSKWVLWRGKYYYCGKSGAYKKSAWIGNYYVNANGCMVTNQWVGKYYVGSTGLWTGQTRSKEWIEENGNIYYLDNNYNKVKYWQQIGAKGFVYFFDSNGVMQKGLQLISGCYYFFDGSGVLQINTSITIDNMVYTFDKLGRMTSKVPIENSTGTKIAEYACQFVGNKYVYGGSWNGEKPYTPTDCSGFTQGVFRHFGISIPRVAVDQSNCCFGYGYATGCKQGIRVTPTLANLKAGDLLFYSDSSGAISHVAMYIGNATVVHDSNSSPYPAGGVKTSPFSYRTPVCAVRFWE